jgi:hypothetical protein
MSRDVRETVLNCGHCRPANTTSHLTQQILKALSTNKPFNITVIKRRYSPVSAIWQDLHPWHLYQKSTFRSSYNTSVLTLFCSQWLTETPHHRQRQWIQRRTATSMWDTRHPILRGLPWGKQCTVAKIGVIDHQTYEQWQMDALFACYAWNSSPIDGTDILRSFATKSCPFRFPGSTDPTRRWSHH